MGKTAFVLNIAQYMAFKSGVTTCDFQSGNVKGAACKPSAVNGVKCGFPEAMRTGNLKDEDWTKLVEGANIIGRSNLIIDDTPVSVLRNSGPNAGSTSWSIIWRYHY